MVILLQSSYYLSDSRVIDSYNRVKTVQKVSRQDFPYGYGEDSGGGNTVKLLESTVARFGPIASFTGTYRANRWTLAITQRNHAYLPGILYNYNYNNVICVCVPYIQSHTCTFSNIHMQRYILSHVCRLWLSLLSCEWNSCSV